MEVLLPVERLGACLDARGFGRKRTAPCFDLVVAGILVPLPIILRAECFKAGSIRTSVRAIVALLMFPEREVIVSTGDSLAGWKDGR